MSPLDFTPDNDRTRELTEKIKVFCADLGARKTRQSYEERLVFYLVPFFGRNGMDWRKLTVPDLWTFRDYLTNQARKRKLKPSSLNSIIISFRSFLKYYANREEAINPFPHLATRYSYKVPKQMPKYLESEDVEKLLSCKMPRKFRIYLLVLLYGGLRASEGLALQKRDISIIEGVMQVRVRSGKGGRERITFITDKDAQKEISDYLEKLIDRSYVFPTRNGRKQSLPYAHKLTKQLCQESGVKFHLHMLRHTYATDLVSKAVPIQYIQKLLGHSSVVTTQIYAFAKDVDILKMVKGII